MYKNHKFKEDNTFLKPETFSLANKGTSSNIAVKYKSS